MRVELNGIDGLANPLCVVVLLACLSIEFAMCAECPALHILSESKDNDVKDLVSAFFLQGANFKYVLAVLSHQRAEKVNAYISAHLPRH